MPTISANYEVLIERLAGLDVSMRLRFDTIENKLDDLSKRMGTVEVKQTSIEQREIQCAAVSDNKITAAHRRLDELEPRLKILEKYLPIVQLMQWALPIIGGLVIVLLWNIFTGTIVLR